LESFPDKNKTVKSSLWVVLAVFFFASLGVGAGVPEQGDGGQLAEQTETGLSFSRWISEVKSRKLRRIQDALSILPEAYRSHFVLMFKSRSLHESSFQNPRVLMFGEDAHFIVTFNGDPSQRGYRAVETVEFDSVTSKFAFREVLFPEGGPGEVQVSEDNPEKCLKCHTAPARPIWDSHPAWPGAYGEMYLSNLSPLERVEINQFVASASQHPRYRHLSHLSTFAADSTFKPTSQDVYSGVERFGPNADFTSLLAKQNFRSIFSEIQALPGFDSSVYVLLAALEEGCGDLGEFLPASLRSAFFEHFERVRKAAEGRNAEQEVFKRMRLTSPEARQTFRYHPVTQGDAIRFRAVAEALLGVSTSNWTMEMEKETFDFDSAGPSFRLLEGELLKRTGGDRSRLEQLSEVRKVSSSEKYCRALRELSVASLASTGPELRLPKVRLAQDQANAGRPVLLTKCISCHQNGPGPHIPFSDEAAFRSQLKDRIAPHGKLLDEVLYRLSPEAGPSRMPLGLNPSEADRQELLRYIGNLVETKP
jgi:hypothetical protein